MKSKRLPSLNTTFGVALLLLLVVLGAIFLVYREASERAVERVAQARVQQTIATCSHQVTQYLAEAEESVRQLRATLERPDQGWDEAALLRQLGTLMLYRPGLAEISILFPESTGLRQLSVVRQADGSLQGVRIEGPRAAQGSLDSPPAAWQRQDGPILVTQDDGWTDMRYHPFDAGLPEAQRRIGLSYQGRCAPPGLPPALLRVGLLSDDLAKNLMTARPEGHEVLLCDTSGRPLIRPEALQSLGDNCFEPSGDLLRLQSGLLTPPWVKALKLIGPSQGRLPHFRVYSERAFYIGGAAPLEGGRDWITVVLVPEALYLAPLRSAARGLLIVWCLLIVGVGAVGMALKIYLRRDLELTAAKVAELEDFQFGPGQPGGHFLETQRVLDVMEGAKTSLRGFSKYAPIHLARQLHHLRREPELGGSLVDATVLFTDIQGFTRVSESMDPNEMAQLLGLYLEVVADCIHQSGGVVDKFIGDAAMALWNVPLELPAHPVKACAAAWAILEQTGRLFESAQWRQRPPWVTRIGIHCDLVMVGHFGSPIRMNYTAMGDGVNLASRLEGLNKLYGSRILVSQAVFQQARHDFDFCHLDRVAVAGKTAAVDIYQLLGPPGSPRLQQARDYEAALLSYFARDFAAALRALEAVADLEAAAVLRARCQHLAADPPASDWDGVFRPSGK